MDSNSTAGAQRAYARIAGLMFLFVNLADLFGLLTTSRIRGAGDFADAARRILASEHLFRTALASLTLGWIGTMLLGYALYVTLAPANKRLAQLALFLRLGESAVGGATGALNFAAVSLYSATRTPGPLTNEQLHAIISFAGSTTESGFFVATMFFTPASVLFFYLFWKSRYIPRWLATLGLLGSAVALILTPAVLIFPEYAGKLQLGLLPVGIAEYIVGFWLLIAGIRPGEEPAAA